MTCLKKLLSILLLGTAITACGGDNNSASGQFEIVDNAGTIEQVDPRFAALIPSDVNIQKLAEGFMFTEGPVWDRRNNQLYFSDVRGNAIYSWSEANGVAPFIQPVAPITHHSSSTALLSHHLSS